MYLHFYSTQKISKSLHLQLLFFPFIIESKGSKAAIFTDVSAFLQHTKIGESFNETALNFFLETF
jgi:hypothetical protein